jgi:hypothetical protein
MKREVKIRKFDLDKELATLPSWSAYGTVWRSFKSGESTKTPDCTAENPCLRTGWYSFGDDGEKPAYEYISYTVSNHQRVIAQGFDNAFHARLLAASPDLLRFVKKIADGEALALSVVEDAKALLKEIRQGVHVPTLHDSTVGPFDPDEYETEFHG